MDWFDIDHNGIVDGRDFFILNEIFGFDEEDKQEEMFSPTIATMISMMIFGDWRVCYEQKKGQ